MPSGLAMGLAMNHKAMENYGHMTEAEKERIILRCRSAETKEDMEAIIDSIGGQISDAVNTEKADIINAVKDSGTNI